MTSLLSAQDIILNAKGHSLHEQSWVVEGITSDITKVEKNWLFVAANDQSALVSQAMAKGASAAMVERAPLSLPSSFPLIHVPSALSAMADLCHAALTKTNASIIGVWDKSEGKKPTRLLSHLLSQLCRSNMTAESENVPACTYETLINVAAHTTHILVDLDNKSENFSHPLSVCFIPCIGANPLACANSLSMMPKGSEMIVNADDPYFSTLCALLNKKGSFKITTYGQGKKNAARLTSFKSKESRSLATAEIGRQLLTLPLTSAHIREALDAVGATLLLTKTGLNPYLAAEVLATRQESLQTTTIETQKTVALETMRSAPLQQSYRTIVDQLDRLLSGLVSSYDDEEMEDFLTSSSPLKQMVG